MRFLIYFITSIISFLGLLVGYLLLRIAPEEQAPLAKYFSFTRRFALLLIFAFVVFYYTTNVFYLLTLLAYAGFIVFIEYGRHDPSNKIMLSYAVLGAIFFLSSKNLNLFVIESSLIFLYGAISMSLVYNRKAKNMPGTIFYNCIFIIVANSLSYFIPVN